MWGKPVGVKIVKFAIDARIHELDSARGSRAYEKQKCQLELELQCFLGSLPSAEMLHSAQLQDILRFLVWKDNRGRTQVHREQCPFQGRGRNNLANVPFGSQQAPLIQQSASSGPFPIVRGDLQLGMSLHAEQPGSAPLHQVILKGCGIGASTHALQVSHPVVHG